MLRASEIPTYMQRKSQKKDREKGVEKIFETLIAKTSQIRFLKFNFHIQQTQSKFNKLQVR